MKIGDKVVIRILEDRKGYNKPDGTIIPDIKQGVFLAEFNKFYLFLIYGRFGNYKECYHKNSVETGGIKIKVVG